MNHAWNDARDKCKGLCLWDACCLHRLERGLEKIVNAYTPQPQNIRTRDSLIRRLNDVIQQESSSIARDLGGIHVKDISLKAYGSYIIGVYCKSADMDVTLEGTILDPSYGKVSLADIPRGVKVKLLKSVLEKLNKRQLIQGEADTCLHARVPIVTFVESESEVSCDLSVGNFEACTKSRVISWMCQIDRRVPLLLALVKSWSKQAGIGNPRNGGFNSFALTLLVVFHLQTVEPAILPPICSLFNVSPNMHAFKLTRKTIGLAARRATKYAMGQYGSARLNKQSVFDLFASFILRCGVTLQIWSRGAHRDWRISVWDGAWRQEPFGSPYRALIEDPFDHEDNCARTLGKVGEEQDRMNQIAIAFHKAFARIRSMKGLVDVNSLLRDHFHDPSATKFPSFITETENHYEDVKFDGIATDVNRIIRRSVEQWDLDRLMGLTDGYQYRDNNGHQPKGYKRSKKQQQSPQQQQQQQQQGSKFKTSLPRRYRRPVSKRRRECHNDQSYVRDQYDPQWVLEGFQSQQLEESSNLQDHGLQQSKTVVFQESNENALTCFNNSSDNILSCSNSQNQEYMKSVLWALRGFNLSDSDSNPQSPLALSASGSRNVDIQHEPITRYCSLKKDSSIDSLNKSMSLKGSSNNNSSSNFSGKVDNILQHSLLSTLLAHHSSQTATQTCIISNDEQCVDTMKSISSIASSSSSTYSPQAQGRVEVWKESVLNVAAEMEQTLSYSTSIVGASHLTSALRSLRKAFVELDKLEAAERCGLQLDKQDSCANLLHDILQN
eukprot:TRINITY_DN4749_c0_g1_i4.p1 TRINITY_DN4749_c0_g1~~TRINITY_DN4749_c0_g1_i4.p1  ORF type:complete len:780 (+),score=71.72 TRINITY_DN4749_c0_g1_i4:329-2668(+)